MQMKAKTFETDQIIVPNINIQKVDNDKNG
jgi:hypothetical protein